MTVRRTAASFISAALALVAGSAAAAAPLAPGQGAPRDTAQAEIRLAMVSVGSDPGAALQHARAALALASAQPNSPKSLNLKASAAWLAGEALVRLERPAEALPSLDLASAAAEDAEPTLRGDIAVSRGRAEVALGRVGRGLEDFQAAFHTFEHANKPQGMAVALQEIGVVYLQARDYPRALDYYDQASKAFPEQSRLHVATENNRGEVLKEMGRLAASETAFRIALEDAARMGDRPLQAHILANIALTQVHQGKLDEAQASLDRGLALVQEDPATAKQRFALLAAAADLESARGNTSGAVRLLDEVFEGVPAGDRNFSWRDIHALAAAVYEKAGRLRDALDHLRAFKRIDDQGRALAASTEAALLGARFDFANQNATIARLEADNLKRDFALAKARSRFTVLLGGVIIICALLLILTMHRALRSARRSRTEIEAVNRELGAANLALEKALNAKTEFLAMTSHEIRTPLNGILGMTQVMLAEPGVGGELKSRLEVIRASGVTMNDMLTDLLDIAKIEKGQMSVEKAEFNLIELVSELGRMWSDQAKTKGLAFRLHTESCPARIVEDRSVLRQILTNLLSNAIKFTSTGEVSLTVAVAEGPSPRLLFKVSDTGIGIPTDQFGRVFEPFTQVDGGTTRAYGGTGLGLAICRNLTQALGGVITLDSAEARGSTFSVELPLTRAAASDQGRGASSTFERSFILVFEDNPLAQAMIRIALKDKVRRLDFAVGWDGLRDAFEEAPDLVLVDGAAMQRQCPDDPFAAVAALRSRFAGVPLAALWPSMSREDADRLAAIGVDAALGKPISAAALAAGLEEIYAGFLTDAAPAAANAA